MRILKESEPRQTVGRWLAISVICVGAGLGTAGCTAAAGAGVAAVAIGAAIATSECYGYVDVLVTDGVTGGRACDANVSAARGDEVVPFTSCFYAPLTEGRWKLAVEKPGYQSVTSEIQVDPQEHCERVVHYISVRLDSLTAPPASDWTARPIAPSGRVPAAGPSSTAPPAPAPIPAVPEPPPPAVAPPGVPGAPQPPPSPPPTTPPSAAPAPAAPAPPAPAAPAPPAPTAGPPPAPTAPAAPPAAPPPSAAPAPR